MDDEIDTKENDSGDEEHLTAEDGLSSDVLAILRQFQQMGALSGREYCDTALQDDLDTTPGPTTDTDSSVIAATMRRLQRQQGELAAKQERAVSDRTTLDLLSSEQPQLAHILFQEGVVRVDGVLPPNICDECLEQINRNLAETNSKATSSIVTNDENDTFNSKGFGNVFSRTNRYDMFLRNEGVFERALASMLQEGSILGGLFEALLEGLTGTFHEFSSLISDPTSASQSIHPDSRYTEHAPIWTVFVALQDIETNMGPTVFLPRTNTFHCHETLKSTSDKNHLLETCQYRRSTLRKGDCAIMDSRLFHFGGANESQTRRVLLYFTIRNPKHAGEYPTGGSLFPELSMTTQDFSAIRTF